MLMWEFTISSFRCLTVGFSIAAIIIVVQILDVSKLDRSNKLLENTSIAAQYHQGRTERIKFDIDTIKAKIIDVQVEGGRTFSVNHSEAMFNRPLEPSTVWREIKKLGDSVSLYPANYNVEKVRWALQSAKIIWAEKMFGDTALKWTLVLDGNQRVIFKPSLHDVLMMAHIDNLEKRIPQKYREPKMLENSRLCFIESVHENYWMLDLRNMPFAVGRKFNWFTDIVPVAGAKLTGLATITQDGGVCILWHCAGGKTPDTYCFPKGDITGSVMVWLDQPILKEIPQNTSGPWTLYHPRQSRPNVSHTHHKLLPGDDSFCKWFRTTGSYKENGRFVAILDMAVMNYIMSSSDSKDTYIINDKNEKVNVFIDLGKSFYPEKLRLIAPIYQCCKIRKKVYDALIKLQYNFEEAFNNETKTDQLYPVLDFDELNAMKTRIHTILKFVEVCQYRFGQSSVYLNI